MQELISRFGGTPALILKLVFLGVINGAAIWAIPALLATSNWVMLGILLFATLALDFFMLSKRFVPGKYVIIGAILLLVFQLIPIGYTVGIAFTNYSTGHIGTKEEAIVAIQRDSVAETEGAVELHDDDVAERREGALVECPAASEVGDREPEVIDHGPRLARGRDGREGRPSGDLSARSL